MNTLIKERPILFKGEMVNAILDGRKTMTRRVCKPAENTGLSYVVTCENSQWGDEEGDVRFSCPYGKVGDRLWVKETWQLHSLATDVGTVVYRASENKSWTEMHRLIPVEHISKVMPKPFQQGWRPSIFMPRWASRITLEITAIRIERLRHITEQDAMAEGVRNTNFDEPVEPSDFSLCPDCGGANVHTDLGENYGVIEVDCNTCDTYKKRFKILWQSINGEESWIVCPWVWVVEFKQVAV